MSVNIEALFQHLMEDPDLIPPEGEEKEDIAMAMATQRAKQSNNNVKALNMAGEDRTISKLLAFIKAEGDSPEDKQFIADYGKHQRNFALHGKKIEAAAKKGNEYEWPKIKAGDIEGDERVGETSYAGKVQKKEWEDAYAFLTEHTPDMVDAHEQQVALGTAGGQDVEGDPDDDASPDAPEDKQPTREQRRGITPDEGARAAGEARRQLSPEERAADRKKRLEAAEVSEGAEALKDLKPHHSLTSAVDAISDADSDADLDYYGNDPDAPFHVSRFGDGVTGVRAYHDIHDEFEVADLAEAFDQLEKEGKQYTLNLGSRKEGYLQGDAVRDMMGRFFEAQGRQEGASSASEEGFTVPGQRPTNAAQKWFDDNVPDYKSGAVVENEWDEMVKENDLTNKPEEVLHDHLYSFLKGKGKNPPTPPKAQATAEHVEPDAQKEIVIASQSDNPEDEIGVVLAEHARAVIDNPVLNPHQQKLMIASAEAMAEIAGKKVSTEDNPIVITPIDPVETSKDILTHAANIHIEAESNGATDEEKEEAANNIHIAALIHETAGGDAEEVLNTSGVDYKKLKNGQYYFHSSSAAKSREDWGKIENLAARDAKAPAPEEEAPEATPEAPDDQQGAFDFDAPAPEPPAIEVTPEAEEAPKSAAEQLSDAARQRQSDAGTQRVRAEQVREYEGLVSKLRSASAEDKEAAVAEIHALGEKVNPNGGGDASVKRTLDNFEAIGERDPKDPSGPANNTAMHRALGGTPTPEEPPAIEVAPEPEPTPAKEPEPETTDEPVDHLQEVGNQVQEIRDRLRNNRVGQLEKEISTRQLAHIDTLVQQAGAASGDQQADLLHRAIGNMKFMEGHVMQGMYMSDKDGEGKRFYNPPDWDAIDAPRDMSPHDTDALRKAKDDMLENVGKLAANIKGTPAPYGGATDWKGLVQKTQDLLEGATTDAEIHKALLEANEHIDNIKQFGPSNLAVPGHTWKEPALKSPEGGTPTKPEEVKPETPTPEETPSPEPEPEPEEIKVTPPDSGDESGESDETSEDGDPEQPIEITDPEPEASDGEPVGEPAPARQRRPRAGQQSLGLPKPTAAERRGAQPARSSAQAELDDAGVKGAPEDGSTPTRSRSYPRGERDELGLIDNQGKRDFLLDNKMSAEYLSTLSDEALDKAYTDTHKKKSDKAMSDHLNGKPDKEGILKAMAKAHGKEGDEGYLQELREEHQFASADELVKEHKAVEKEKAANKFEHEKSQANANALGMEKLPEEGIDKLHAMDRARDVAKKMNDSTMAVQKGGKPLLDSNSQQHLLDLLHDAINKGELTQEDIDGIADEANSMGKDYLNDDHKASIDGDNDRQRAHHEEFLDHAEGTSEGALQRRGHDLDHSKAHELHHYEEDEEGNKTRTGSSHSTRDEDGSVKHMDASGEGGVPGSEDDAVEGMESQHPPKLLGLDEDGKAAQKEHFDLMKKGAAVPLSDEEMSRFKELEGKNPDLASPQYKGQLLGAQRHQISGEGGGDKMSGMGIDGKDHDEAAESSCKPPPGAIPSGPNKGWNPDTHRWCDKEYLDELKGQLGPGEASYHPDGVHAGTDNAHLDQDADGNVQAAMVTPTGVHKVNPSSGEMKTADGGAVSQADVLGHHLKDHAGGKVDKDTLHAMGMNHSEKHTGEGQKRGNWDPKVLTDVKNTPGAKVLGKLGRMMQRNKKSEEGKPDATATDRQRARRDTEGSPSSSFLNKLGKHTKESLKDAAEELPGYLGGGLLRGGQTLPGGKTVGGTDRWQDKQVRQAADKVAKRRSASDKLTERVNRVMEENG